MLTEYALLTQVKFRHRFFSSSKLECFTVQPDAHTQQSFLNLGILYRQLSDGFILLYNSVTHQEEISRDAILDNVVLRFEMVLHDPYFFNYTTGESQNMATSIYYFTNAVNLEVDSIQLQLQKKEFVTADDAIDIAKFDKQFFNKPFGVIDIKLQKDLQHDYILNFKEKESHWRYIIAGNHLKNLGQLAIIGNDMAFDGPTTVMLPNEKEALSFVSTLPIPHSEKPNQYFKLVDHYEKQTNSFKVVINALPVPDIKHISSSVKDKDDNRHYSEIFIY